MSTIVQTIVEDGILELRLNRPDRLNALNEELIGELTVILRELNRNREVRVGIITGEGKGFCAGADLKAGSSPGSIPGTDLNIDFREIQSRHREIGAQFDDHIVVYCQSGRRSNIAAETLADLGYRQVYNVAGSMNAWIEAGFPVARPKR